MYDQMNLEQVLEQSIIIVLLSMLHKYKRA